MSPRLRVASVSSAAELQRCLSPGQAGTHGDVEGDVLIVDDDAEAERLVERYPNVEYVTERDTNSADPSATRLDVDSDSVTYECGVNDCSRDVDSPDDRCWQHAEE